jgi:hypothetical protein
MVRNLAAFGVPPLDVKITLIDTPPLRTIASRPLVSKAHSYGRPSGSPSESEVSATSASSVSADGHLLKDHS